MAKKKNNRKKKGGGNRNRPNYQKGAPPKKVNPQVDPDLLDAMEDESKAVMPPKEEEKTTQDKVGDKIMEDPESSPGVKKIVEGQREIKEAKSKPIEETPEPVQEETANVEQPPGKVRKWLITTEIDGVMQTLGFEQWGEQEEFYNEIISKGGTAERSAEAVWLDESEIVEQPEVEAVTQDPNVEEVEAVEVQEETPEPVQEETPEPVQEETPEPVEEETPVVEMKTEPAPGPGNETPDPTPEEEPVYSKYPGNDFVKLVSNLTRNFEMKEPDLADIESGWIVIRGHNSCADDVERATEEQLKAMTQNGFSEIFRMLDDDGEVYYSGVMKHGDETDGFEPLDEFGMGNAGCTEIQYKNEKNQWEIL